MTCAPDCRSTPWVSIMGVGLLAAALGLRTGRAAEPASDAWAAKVNGAIDRGVSWLRACQRADGSFPRGAAAGPLGGLPGLDDSAMWAGGPWDKGADALAVYALAACDVPTADPVLERGFRRLRLHWDGRSRAEFPMGPGDGVSTYFVSLCLLALDAAGDPTSLSLHATPEERRTPKRAALSPRDRAWATELVSWLERAQDGGAGSAALPAEDKKPKTKRKKPAASAWPTEAEGGGFGYESPCRVHGSCDHSNTQFAALGLKAAARLGVAVPMSMWARVLNHMLAAQEREGPQVPALEVPGARAPEITPSPSKVAPSSSPKSRARGWAYESYAGSLGEKLAGSGTDGATLSMTAGGVSTLVIARSELLAEGTLPPAVRAACEQGIRDGFAWIAHHLPPPYGKGEAPSPAGAEYLGDALDDFYFLYGLERACILGGVRSLSDLDWYRIGAERILARQREDGSFLSKNQNNGNGLPLIDSGFALLFLKRALFRLPDLLPAVTEPSKPVEPPKEPDLPR